MPSKIKVWVEAMRLRTLPVSVAGVIAGCGCAALYHEFDWQPALICLLFAVAAQIASNFANEYYDYAYGLDKKGREGFRRGVTEGDISPRAMFGAIWLLICFDSLLGLTLLHWGGLWLLLPGIAIAIFAVGYSAGPYPLSHHGLGDIAVVLFFGLVPVVLTQYVQTDSLLDIVSITVGLSVGLMAANVLIVNNYRDMEDDREVGKHTTVVIFGRRKMGYAYLGSGVIAATAVSCVLWSFFGIWICLPYGVYLFCHLYIYHQLCQRRGKALNPLLGLTACNLLLFASLFAILCFTIS